MIFESICTVKWGDVYKTACNSTIEQIVHHLELKLKVWISLTSWFKLHRDRERRQNYKNSLIVQMFMDLTVCMHVKEKSWWLLCIKPGVLNIRPGVQNRPSRVRPTIRLWKMWRSASFWTFNRIFKVLQYFLLVKSLPHSYDTKVIK